MLRTGGLQLGLVLVSELDKDVFEARRQRANFGDGDAVLQELFAEFIEVEMIVDERMNGLPENCGAADAGNLTRITQSAGHFRRGDFDAQGAVGLNLGQFAK